MKLIQITIQNSSAASTVDSLGEHGQRKKWLKKFVSY